jgi:nicotinate phosphoribosyltransferase
MVMMGDEEAAYRAFDEIIETEVPRIALIDTFSDEKVGALKAARSIPGLQGVRLDTPGSRRGSFKELVQEVRWELDLNGHGDVSIFASGGLNEQSIADLVIAGVDGFGVGTCITNAPTVDFSMDIVEIEGRPVAKRGKFGGRKHPFRCPDCLTCDVSLDPDERPLCACGGKMEMMEVKLLDAGRRVHPERSPAEIRDSVLEQLEKVQ